MRVRQWMVDRWPAEWPVRPFAEPEWAAQRPTFRDADPAVIEAAAKRAAARPAGNWFVVGASREITGRAPFPATVAGRELVLWRDSSGRLKAGPGVCPHLGAPLAQARIDRGDLVCRWHGMRLGRAARGSWCALPCHDDGVLVWVRLDSEGGERPTAVPMVPARPDNGVRVASVATMRGVCEPEDVVANRLDPWHGAWFHPYSFARLRVLSAPATDAPADEDRFVVAVTFRVAGRWGVPVRAEFRCPGPRTVVMRIVEGEGTGSVVETHATPLGPGPDGLPRSAVVEATVATSERPGFAVVARASPVLRPLMRHVALRLWRDDLAYAERRFALRHGR